jgi:predicted DNA-binding ribbon-helix-helix protein
VGFLLKQREAGRNPGLFFHTDARAPGASLIFIASNLRMLHNVPMRTSITLDDDVYQLASMYAAGRGITLGAAVGELVRRTNTTPRPSSDSSRIKTLPNGLRVFASRGRVITPEMVKATQEDEIA